ncbi:MAG: DUF2970 domain-containing protein [Halioglobus sp.]|nr:DUF2970 domain-containing protein [Halioglobus sp.]
MSEQQPEEKPLTLLEVAGSVLAAGFGVQSQQNKRRDFTRGKPWQFIVVGLVFTGLFLGAVITVVSLVLP